MKTVLILDDDRDLRGLLRTSLAAHGLEVVEASRARDAEELLKKTQAAVVVVDGVLLDGSGLEFVERLREANREIRVVFFSAYYRDMETFQRLTALDVSLVAYKPIDPESFVAEIVKLAGARRTSAPTPSFALELAQMHREFAEQLPAKIGAIEQAVAAATADAKQMGQARDLAHALRGSAGSFGFPAVGEAIGAVEYLLAEAATRDSPGQPYLWERVDAALRDARQAAAREMEKRRSGA